MGPAEKMRDWFDALQSREKTVVVTGAVLVAVTLLWAVFDPLLVQRSQLQARQAGLVTEMQWMQDQIAVMARLHNSCPQQQIQAMAPGDFIARQAERNRVQLVAINARSASVSRVELRASDANGFLRLGHQLVCQGYGLQALAITRAEDGLHQAVMEVSHDR